MTLTELKDDVLQPQFNYINENLKKMIDDNCNQHQYLYAAVDEAKRESKMIADIVCKSNGRQSLVDAKNEAKARIATIEEEVKALKKDRRSSDIPRTKTDIAKTAGIGTAKYGGLAASITALLKIMEHFWG